MLTLLSSDPGYTNYGWAAIQFRKRGPDLAFRVLENGLCTDTVNQLKAGKVLLTQLESYKQFIASKIEQFDVDALCAERYMTRGINGPSVEMVNFMLGVMITSSGLPVRLWPAVVWKGAVRRQGVDLDYWYKYSKTSPHQLDSVLMGIYTGYVAFGFKEFGTLNLKKAMPKIIEQAETTTIEKLYNRKLRKNK